MRLIRMIRPVLAVLAVAVMAGCDAVGGALTSHSDAVARAGGHELSIDETVSLIGATNPRVQPQKPVVEALANIWIDYVLLARQIRKDSTFADLDLEPVVEPELQQARVYALRDAVIDVDTMIGDDELRALYEEELPGAQIRARHILLTAPPEATPEQKDSVRALAERVRDRARAGEDFGELAREFSDDHRTATEGGDLGVFGRGNMVEPFENAAFALDPGEISDVVESPFGLHVIKVEEKRVAPFEEVDEMFRRRVKERRFAKAESTYVKTIFDPESATIEEEAVAVLKSFAQNPRTRLTKRASERPLVTYEGGALTAGELLAVIRTVSTNQRQNILGTPDPRLDGMLQKLAGQDALVAEAERRGTDLAPVRRDSLVDVARERMLNYAGQLRLRSIEVREGETEIEAVERAVNETLKSVLAGDRHLVNLGAIAFVLRQEYGATVFDHNIPAVLERAGAGRDTAGPGRRPGPRPERRPAPNAPRTLPGLDTTTTGTSGTGGA